MAPFHKMSLAHASSKRAAEEEKPPSAVITSFLLGNLHCPTCVSAIRRTLHEACPQHIRWVSPNVVTSVVTVEHAQSPSIIHDMAAALENAGFDICGVTSNAEGADLQLTLEDSPEAADDHCNSDARDDKSASSNTLPRWMNSSRSHGRPNSAQQKNQDSVHLENCEQCRISRAHPWDEKAHQLPDDGESTPQASSRRNTPARSTSGSQAAGMSSKSFVTIETDDPSHHEPTWRATIAVGGMTCAVCVNTITDELKKLDWVSKVSVNLVSNSATVEYNGGDKVDKLVEFIEDLGYEATIDSVTSIDDDKPRPQERTVEIQVDGIYCEHCPGRVISSLAGFRRQLDVITQPTQKRPIIKITYMPDAPRFTIRDILAAIEVSDPALKASVYHPPTLEERSKRIQAQHQRQILYRVILTGLIAIPTLIIGVVYMSLVSSSNSGRQYLTAPWTSGISRAQVAMFIMATPVYFSAADLFHVRAIKEIRALWRRGSKTPVLQRFYRFGSMNTLISLGTTIAYMSSLGQMIAAGAYHDSAVNNSDFYFDSVVFLTFFLLLGRLIESFSKSKTGDAVDLLGKLRPSTALLVEKRGTEKAEQDVSVKTDLLDFGDIVRIPHGMSPPVDGVIVLGQTSFDESSLTGESRLIKKSVDDTVFSGTVNKDSPILVRVTGVAGTSMLDQIVQAVREGQTKRAPMEHIADILTTYFVPVITLIAVLTWIIWLSLGLSGRLPDKFLGESSGGWVSFSLEFAIAVFVVACPCGLALAAPTAIFVGGGMAAKHGILAKGGGEAFETASRVDCVVFDKTGTLTQGGEPSVTDSALYAKSTPGRDEESIIEALRTVEENSSHPIARAIVTFCKSREASQTGQIEELQEIPGKGMKALFRITDLATSFNIIVGNEGLMQDFNAAIPDTSATLLETWKKEAKSVALVAVQPTTVLADGANDAPWQLVAILAVSDPVRPEATAVIAALQRRGTRVWMLSGDNATTAAAVASSVGIPSDQVIAGVLPSEKAAKISYLQRTLKATNSRRLARFGAGQQELQESSTRRATVAMVGDGINDAPALATADVGVAIGSGSDVAISSAAFVLLSSDLHAVATLLDLSAAVFLRIRLNFAWALVYNLVAVPVAAGCLYPVVSGGQHVRLDPVWASLAMALSSISVVVSSLALRSGIPWVGFRERRIEE